MDFDETFAAIKGKVTTDFLVHGEQPAQLALKLTDGDRMYLPVGWSSDREKVAIYDRLSRDFGGKTEFYIFITEVWESQADDGVRPSQNPKRVECLAMWGKHVDGRAKVASWEIKRDPLRLEARGHDERWTGGVLDGVLFGQSARLN